MPGTCVHPVASLNCRKEIALSNRLLLLSTQNGSMDTSTYPTDASEEADDLPLTCFRRMTP
jgi:hypothetical protein